jgi:hypothetical protein
MKYEGICVAEGYIQRQSITIVEHSLGRTNIIKGGLDYVVRFQADICMPHAGQHFRAPVTLMSKIGIHAETTPIKVLLPRDLHIGMGEFDDIEEGQEVEFEVVGARFQQGDESIVVLGKLLHAVKPASPDEIAAEASEAAVEPMIAASTGDNSASEKRVVTVDASASKPEAVRRKRIRLNPAGTTNESKQEGKA